ncbi:hypothetical protein EJB05_26465 [Eragrostis curvula]|uniref:Uncharacterized protein n=1 Tax=Eragrostis curvula TaxID=38414 RepID=A0A5J9UJV3_9POAL|nr:hypothetical protein EJB05_26465 [Eragrostis curvula]
MSRAPRLCLSPPLIGHPRPRTSTRRPHRPRPWTSPHRPQCRPLARQLVLSYRPATKIDRKMAPGRKLGTSKRTPAALIVALLEAARSHADMHTSELEMNATEAALIVCAMMACLFLRYLEMNDTIATISKDKCVKNKGNREKVVIQQKTGSDLIASLCIAMLCKDKYKDVPAIPIDLFKECHCSSKTVLTKPVKKAIAT